MVVALEAPAATERAPRIGALRELGPATRVAASLTKGDGGLWGFDCEGIWHEFGTFLLWQVKRVDLEMRTPP
jgi:hypothetical protein